MHPIRVMIVEDSPTVRECLVQLVDEHPRLSVVSACQSAEEALGCVHRVTPDVISMDIQLPGINGVEATRRIMETRPTPIVVLSRSIHAEEISISMEALRAGAVSAIEKPTGSSRHEFSALAQKLCRELIVMSQVRVIRQRFNHAPQRAFPPEEKPPAVQTPARANGPDRPFRMLGMVASTGGPRAVEVVLGALGARFELPVVLVQHMTASFQSGFVTWLARVVPQVVLEAQSGQIPRPGYVYVAPADAHVRFCGDRLVLDKGSPISGQRPSGTVLLQSLAKALGPQSIGVVLTGMGDDGADGLLAMRRAGAYTIVEDESTAVIYGMPRVAKQLGAACVSLPLEFVGPVIDSLVPAVEEAYL